MPVTITLTDTLAAKLQKKAELQRLADYLLDTNHASPLVTLSHPLRQQVLWRAQVGM